MSNEIILFISMSIYFIALILALIFDLRIMMFSSILWLVPITIVDNTFIVIFSVVMFLLHIIIPVTQGGDKDEFI